MCDLMGHDRDTKYSSNVLRRFSAIKWNVDFMFLNLDHE